MTSLYQNTLWPSVSVLVEKQFIGLALGLLNCFQAIAQAFVPLIVAAIYVKNGRYIPETLDLFIGLCTSAALVAVVWVMFDYRNGTMFKTLKADGQLSAASTTHGDHLLDSAAMKSEMASRDIGPRNTIG